MQKLISIIVPVYNEEKNLQRFYDAAVPVLAPLSYASELIFVNDGSQDQSLSVLRQLAQQDPRVRVLDLSRNFGKEIATTAGLHAAGGAACLMIDADLQHPVELIPAFVKKWENGAEIVVGVREKNQGEGIVKRVGSAVFYKIMRLISQTPVTPNATDFRLLDRVVVDAFKQFTEKQRMTRALIDWLGFERAYISFVANERAEGQPGYSLVKLVKLALQSFVSFSLFPLRLAGYLGSLITVLSGIAGVFIFMDRYFLGNRLNASGSAALGILILFLVGLILVCLGFIALYIASIHQEVINRPLYVVRRRIDHPSNF
ncbi:MAG: glycosyltransferase family 2 protein [Patescibacteria group bacterium]